jgi:hypothetical protein
MTDFGVFDVRGYRTVDVRTGYGEWVATYETTVEDAMDIELLGELREVSWPAIGSAADLGCGTGRTGSWMREHGVAVIVGGWSRPTCRPPTLARRTTTSS